MFSYRKIVPLLITLVVHLLHFNLCSDLNEGLDSDSYDREVEDFEDWLQHKIQKREIIIPSKSPLDTEITRSSKLPHLNIDNDEDEDYESGTALDSSRETYEELYHSSRSGAKDLTDGSNKNESDSQHLQTHLQISNHEEHSSLTEVSKEKEHHPVKEFIFIRQSDSDSSELTINLVNHHLHPKTSGNPEKHELFPDTCSEVNHPIREQQVCSTGPRYNIEPFYSEKYDLSAEMEKRIVNKRSSNTDVCDYSKELLPGSEVNVRSHCPFHWTVSSKNSARIPETLFSAECSCNTSRRASLGKYCVQITANVSVLWRVGCEDGQHVYREGWEEIAVACVPKRQSKAIIIKPGNIITFTTPK